MGVITERYPAVVTSIEDEENRGRIRVACAQLLGDEDAELPMLVEPVHDWGWFYLPDVGEIVEVEVVVGSDEDEAYGQMSLDNLDIQWRGKRFGTDAELEGENTPSPIHPDFLENYGKRRGFATPGGHVLLFDDTEGGTRIHLTWAQEKPEPGVAAEPEKITQLLIDTDGSVKFTILNQQFIHLKPDNELEVSLEEGKHTLVIKPDELLLNLSEGANLKLNGKDADATAVLGDGAVKVAIADHLQALYSSLKGKLDAFDAHVHPTGMGPSGPPNPAIAAPDWDSNINSSKMSVPDT